MRTMVMNDRPACKVKVENMYVLSNGWEYFLEKANKAGIAFGLVCGFEDELGDVFVPEIQPYIVSSANKECTDALPAPGWYWEDES